MLRYFLLGPLLVLWSATALGGDIILVPVELGAPELFLGEALLDFDAERELHDIVTVQLHVTGYYRDYRSFCYQFGDFGGGVGLGDGEAGWHQGFVVDQSPSLVAEHVIGNTADGGAPFDLVLDFDGGGQDPDWTFLAGGAGTLYLNGLDCESFPPYPMICHCDASAVVESVVLVIQLESLVAIEQRSWGTIKAWYR